MYISEIIDKFDRIKENIRYNDYRKKYNIDKTFKFNGKNIKMYGNGQIIIKENSYIGENSSLQSIFPSKIEIGKKCSISHNVRIYTMNRKTNQDFSKKYLDMTSGNVKIGDYVFIGLNTVILEDTEIGDNTVIGANLVVRGNIPANSIVYRQPILVRPKVF
jgi:maltose O-acetyltransferase